MEFEQLTPEQQQPFDVLYRQHLSSCEPIFQKDRYVMSILIIHAGDNAQAISLQPADGVPNYKRAFNKVLDILRSTPFETAIFPTAPTKHGNPLTSCAPIFSTKTAQPFYTLPPIIGKAFSRKNVLYDEHCIATVQEGVL